MTPDISCEQCRDAVPWYVANLLSGHERATVVRHMASCASCRDALDVWREVVAALHRTDGRILLDTASAATWDHISERIREQNVLPDNDGEGVIVRLQTRDDSTPHRSFSEPPAGRPHERRRGAAPLVAAVATVALIALSVGIFSLFATTRGHASVVAPPPPNCASSQATADLPAHTQLTAIAPLGTDDGWAVGRVWDPQTTAAPATLMLRLQNCHWTPVGTPISAAELLGISMSSAGDGWAVGATLLKDPGTDSQPLNDWSEDQLLVLHYTGGSWQRVSVTSDTQIISAKVEMVSADEGWMLLDHGKRMTIVNSTTAVPSYEYSLLHYLDGAWTTVSPSFLKPSMQVWDFDARQPGDLWLVGFDTQSDDALVAHYSNGGWTSYLGATIGADAGQLFNVSAISPADVWVASSNLYHFDGTRWTKANIQGSVAARLSGANFRQIGMLSSTQGWSFPDTFESQYQATPQATPVLRYEGGIWRWTTLSLQGATLSLVPTGFAPSSATQGWLLGDHLVATDIGTTLESTLLYYDAGTWGVVRQQA